jgi:hypothetical protein
MDRLDVESLLAEPPAGSAQIALGELARHELRELRVGERVTGVVDRSELLSVGEERRRGVRVDNRDRHSRPVGSAADVVRTAELRRGVAAHRPRSGLSFAAGETVPASATARGGVAATAAVPPVASIAIAVAKIAAPESALR